MELLKLVIVDDEPILLQGLLDTYDWESMGFEVVGSAKSGVQALEVIRREQPHVVLTDIRMKQMTGLMVMEEIQKEQISCLFVVLSAYRDFEYANLVLSVYNTGMPMNKDMVEKINGLTHLPISQIKEAFPDKKHGYGVFNILTRLRLKYGDKITYYYETTDASTTCTIKVPKGGEQES